MMASNSHSADHCNITSEITYKILTGVTVVECTLGLPLNLSVLYIFLFRFKFWRTNSVFLFNIVLADLLLVVCLPAKAYYFSMGGRRSDTKSICTAMLFMLFLNRGASIAFLTMLSLDRYLNVVHPGRKNFVKVLKRSPQISILIWLLLLPLTIPTMLKNFECCNSLGRSNATNTQVADVLREVVFFTQILIPFIFLVYCTVRIVNRLKKKTVGDRTKLRRAVLLVVSVVLVFSICFLPCTLARGVLIAVRIGNKPEYGRDWQHVEDVVMPVFDSLMVFSYLDCLLDPLLYCFCYPGFKDAYMSTFCPASLRKHLPSISFTTTTTPNASANNGLSNASIPMLDKPSLKPS